MEGILKLLQSVKLLKLWDKLGWNLLASFIAAIFLIASGYSLAKWKNYRFNRRFGKFFGGYHCRKAICFVLDYYKASQHPTINMGSSNAFILSYLSPVLEKYLGIYPPVVLDDDFKDWEQSLILLGSPFTNCVTKKALENNKCIKFIGSQDNANAIDILLPSYKGNSLNLRDGHFGIILKLKNPFSDGHFLFFLAGLTNEATSAAGLLLRKNWEKILKELGNKEFLIAFKVDLPGEDQTYKVIFSYPKNVV